MYKNSKIESKAFVLISGGIDSTVCLHIALDRHKDVSGIHFDYGQQTNRIEKKNVEKQAEKNSIKLYTVDYREVFKNFAEGTIKDKEYNKDKTVKKGHSVGYVPQRNLHFLTTGAAIAEKNTPTNTGIILYHGAQRNDAQDYPDCRENFMKAAESAINLSTDQNKISIQNPIIDKSKEEVIKIGEKKGIDWKLTFSCYNDKSGNPCGECPACIERKEAFDKIDIKDPVY